MPENILLYIVRKGKVEEFLSKEHERKTPTICTVNPQHPTLQVANLQISKCASGSSKETACAVSVGHE